MLDQRTIGCQRCQCWIELKKIMDQMSTIFIDMRRHVSPCFSMRQPFLQSPVQISFSPRISNAVNEWFTFNASNNQRTLRRLFSFPIYINSFKKTTGYTRRREKPLRLNFDSEVFVFNASLITLVPLSSIKLSVHHNYHFHSFQEKTLTHCRDSVQSMLC